MYVYQQPIIKDRHGEKIYGPYEVGYHYTKNDYMGHAQTYWYCESKWTTAKAAAAQTSYLNGGQPNTNQKDKITTQNEKQQQKALQAKLQAVPDLEPESTYIGAGFANEFEISLDEAKQKAEAIKNNYREDPTEPLNVDIDGETPEWTPS